MAANNRRQIKTEMVYFCRRSSGKLIICNCCNDRRRRRHHFYTEYLSFVDCNVSTVDFTNGKMVRINAFRHGTKKVCSVRRAMGSCNWLLSDFAIYFAANDSSWLFFRRFSTSFISYSCDNCDDGCPMSKSMRLMWPYFKWCTNNGIRNASSESEQIASIQRVCRM